MLNIQQIEALRGTNPQLYETLKRLANASLGLNQGWSLDDQITDGSDFARVASNALTSNQIDPAKPGVLMKGSVPPTWSGAFTYASTTSSLTTTAIPDGSAAITGLAAGATYYFYPYWDETSRSLARVAGGAGSTGFAQSAKTNSAAQQQALQGRVPLSQGAIVAATTTSGTGGGSGGGSGSCLRAGTVVLTKERTVPIERCKVGEHLRCPSTGAARRRRGSHANRGYEPPARGTRQIIEPGQEGPPGRRLVEPGDTDNEGWTRIVRLEVRHADTFIRLHFSNAESLDVIPHHIFTLADGSPIRAARLCLSDVLVGRFGRLTLRKIEVVTSSDATPSTPVSALSSRARLAACHSQTVDEGPALAVITEAPWQKVTISCEPAHQFFAGRHAASVLTHNYTFSS